VRKAVHTPETSIYFNETIRCYTPEGYHLHTHSCENLKSHTANIIALLIVLHAVQQHKKLKQLPAKEIIKYKNKDKNETSDKLDLLEWFLLCVVTQ
jgi:hypothetical protein